MSKGPTVNTLSLAEARRAAINAQGFLSTDKQRRSGWKKINAAIERQQLLQIDSVNVLCRSHYLPVFSRIGLYSQTQLDNRSLSQNRRELFEYWGHEASFLPLRLHPLLRWRMENACQGEGIYGMLKTFAEENRDFIEAIYRRVEADGPLAAGELESGKSKPGWWEWGKGKTALEYLFWCGRISTGKRRHFQRFYDITERVIPAAVLEQPTPDSATAHRQLLKHAAAAHGVASETDLRDYFRLGAGPAKTALRQLLENRELLEVSVEDWSCPGYVPPDFAIGPKSSASALLSPFDPLIWERQRTERLFGFHYRLEFYTPAAKRRFGYYVLPLLHKEKLIARIDLKADRSESVLDVLSIHREASAKITEVRQGLLGQLPLLAEFLGLGALRFRSGGQTVELTAKPALLADALNRAMSH